MKKFLQAFLLVGVGVTGYSQLAQAEAPAPELRPGPYFYAFEECKFGCMDVNGRSITLTGGKAKVGRVPE